MLSERLLEGAERLSGRLLEPGGLLPLSERVLKAAGLPEEIPLSRLREVELGFSARLLKAGGVAPLLRLSEPRPKLEVVPPGEASRLLEPEPGLEFEAEPREPVEPVLEEPLLRLLPLARLPVLPVDLLETELLKLLSPLRPLPPDERLTVPEPLAQLLMELPTLPAASLTPA